MSCGCQSACGCIVLGDGSTTSVVREGDTFTVSATQFVDSVADTECISLAVDTGELTATAVIDPDQDCVAVSGAPDGLRADLELDPASTATVSCGVDGLRIDIPPTPPTVDSAQPGDYLFYSGVGARTGYIDADGSDVNRAAYNALWDAQTLLSETANRYAGLPTIDGLVSTKFVRAGMAIEASSFAPGTTVLSVDSGTALTLSTNSADSGADTEVRIYPYGDGDGMTTFTLPNLDRRFPLGYDNALGGENIGAQGGAEDVTLGVTEIPAHDHNVSADQAGHTHTGTTSTASAHTHGLAGGRSFVTVDSGFANQTISEATVAPGDTFSIPVNVGATPPDYEQQNNSATASAGSHDHTFTTDSTDPAINVTEDSVGGGLGHENMPPYTIGRWLVKT